jgi:hypothetical protein
MPCECGEPLSKKCAYKLCGKCCQDLVCTKHSAQKRKVANKYINANTLVIIHDIIYDLILDFPNDIISIIIDYFDNYVKCVTCNKLFENSINTDIRCKVCIQARCNPLLLCYRSRDNYFDLSCQG